MYIDLGLTDVLSRVVSIPLETLDFLSVSFSKFRFEDLSEHNFTFTKTELFSLQLNSQTLFVVTLLLLDNLLTVVSRSACWVLVLCKFILAQLSQKLAA